LKEKCPNHGFTDLQQIDTFYNGLCHADQDSLNSAAGGNLLARNTNDAFMIIENKARVRMSRNKPQVSNNGKNNDELVNMIVALTKKVDAMSIEKPNHQVNVVSHGYETCGGPHLYYECPATGAFSHENAYAANAGNNGYPQLQGDRNLLSYRSPHFLGPPVLEQQNQVNQVNQNHNVQNRNNQGIQNKSRANNGFQNHNQGFNQNRGFQGNYNQGPPQGNNFQNQQNFGNPGNFQNANHGNQNHGNYQNRG
jgi:hypothetical protein